jgi:carboxypeptidase T
MRQQYSSYQECIDFFESAARSHPDLFRTQFIGKTWEERDILCVTISDGMRDAETKPALFYTGTIHAREWIGIELAIAYARYIIENIDYDPQLRTLLSRATFYMVPCANPDGFEYSRNHFSFWRKNRRQNADGSYGVDLNRNFSVGFTPNKNTTSNVYSGPEPFSEPETAALRDFVLSHPNISIALDYHSQGNVFFPAHNFIHEDAIDATDLNVLASTMAEEIRKVSGREYGVHMGKPPVSLISGSGREFYYSTGALALVVEVGSRNISDYQENMQEHINEQIPALTYALSEAPHYAKEDSLPRVEAFYATDVSDREVTLSWDYPEGYNVYFEIYRSKRLKGYCQSANRIGMTRTHEFTDVLLQSSMNYYYFVRAVDKKRYIKSPFAPVVGVRTAPKTHMFSKILFPPRSEIGYVGEKTEKNKEHFGENSLFVGISESKGECFGVAGFSLDTVPENALIKEAHISFYPMNRVNVQVERYGEWRVGIMDERTVESHYSFDDVKSAKMLGYIDRPTKSSQLSQGIWRTYTFAKQERTLLQNALGRRKVYFRMEGPTRLPLDRASQLMQWDIGYGKFSGGLSFRPKLEISYTLEPVKLELHSQRECTISNQGIIEDGLISGFGSEGEHRYGCFEFDLTQVPDIESTVISDAYLELDAQDVRGTVATRHHIEMVKLPEGTPSISAIRNRQIIERIGYDVSSEMLAKKPSQRFVFDSLAIAEMVSTIRSGEKLSFIIRTSSAQNFCKNERTVWMDEKRVHRPRLILEYVKKRRHAPEPVSNLRWKMEKGMIKLEWDNPGSDGFSGVIVVKNPFHVPSTPYDGQKLYGGSDSYTYDNFGDKQTHKYYAVFSYDDVPNFSEPAFLEFEGQ